MWNSVKGVARRGGMELRTFAKAGCTPRIVMTRKANRISKFDMVSWLRTGWLCSFVFSSQERMVQLRLAARVLSTPRLLGRPRERRYLGNPTAFMQTIYTQRTNLSRSNHVIRVAKLTTDSARYYCYQPPLQTTCLPSLGADMGPACLKCISRHYFFGINILTF